MPTKPHLQTHELSFVRDGYSCMLLLAHVNAPHLISVILLRDIISYQDDLGMQGKQFANEPASGKRCLLLSNSKRSCLTVAVQVEFIWLAQVGAVPGSGQPAPWAQRSLYRPWRRRKRWGLNRQQPHRDHSC